MKFDTIKEATMHWVETFNAIPMGIIEKLIGDGDNFDELLDAVEARLISILDSQNIKYVPYVFND